MRDGLRQLFSVASDAPSLVVFSSEKDLRIDFEVRKGHFAGVFCIFECPKSTKNIIEIQIAVWRGLREISRISVFGPNI